MQEKLLDSDQLSYLTENQLKIAIVNVLKN